MESHTISSVMERGGGADVDVCMWGCDGSGMNVYAEMTGYMHILNCG